MRRCGVNAALHLGFIGFSCALVSSVPFCTMYPEKKGDINGEKGFNSLIFVGWRVFVTAHDMDGREMGGNEIKSGIFRWNILTLEFEMKLLKIVKSCGWW